MIMSAHSVPWRVRMAHVTANVKRIPAPARALAAVCLGVSVVGAVTGWPIVGMIGMGLGGAIILGQENN